MIEYLSLIESHKQVSTSWLSFRINSIRSAIQRIQAQAGRCQQKSQVVLQYGWLRCIHHQVYWLKEYCCAHGSRYKQQFGSRFIIIWFSVIFKETQPISLVVLPMSRANFPWLALTSKWWTIPTSLTKRSIFFRFSMRHTAYSSRIEERYRLGCHQTVTLACLLWTERPQRRSSWNGGQRLSMSLGLRICNLARSLSGFCYQFKQNLHTTWKNRQARFYTRS